MYYARVVFIVEKYRFKNVLENNILFRNEEAVCTVKFSGDEELPYTIALTYGGFKEEDTAIKEGEKLFRSIKKKFFEINIPIEISPKIGFMDTIEYESRDGAITESCLNSLSTQFPGKIFKNSFLGLSIYELQDNEDINDVIFLFQDLQITAKLEFPSIDINDGYKDNEQYHKVFSFLNLSNLLEDERLKFIIKISAFEILISDTEKEDKVYIDLIKQINNKIGVDQLQNNYDISQEDFLVIVNKIKSSIGSLKNKSIMNKAVDLIQSADIKENYWGKSKIEFFKYCYNIRSEIVHAGKYNVNDEHKLNVLNKVLDHFLLDIIDFLSKK